MSLANLPAGKRFAFSILDDTDDSTLENVLPVYELLKHRGLRTTKTVWVCDCPEGSKEFFAADTLDRQPYLEFVRGLARDGFEIAFHGATMESSRRERTVQALELLHNEFGQYPKIFCNHGFNRENVYWGEKRFHTGVLRMLAGLGQRRAGGFYRGDDPNSEYFWGDICREKVKYVRNFTFKSLNILSMNPEMPYALRAAPYVNYWFSTSDAPDVDAFTSLLTRERIDRLEQDGGVCILSTHLGKGFTRDGKVDSRVVDILQYLSTKDGWFVPVSDILDHLLAQRAAHGHLTAWQLLCLETRFLVDQIVGARS